MEDLDAAAVGLPEGDAGADMEAALPEPVPEETRVTTGGPGKTYLAPSSKTWKRM